MKELTLSESILMLAILRLKDNAYGVTIRKKVSEVTEKLYTYGTLYSSLDQLVKKGYVSKSIGEPTAERGGRSKIYYTLTKQGVVALQAARQLQKSIWDGIPDIVIDEL